MRTSRLDVLIDAALLVVSELVTVVLQHAGGAAELALTVSERGLRIEFIDPSRQLPRLDGGDPQSEEEWGLSLVAALSDRWGYSEEAVGGGL